MFNWNEQEKFGAYDQAKDHINEGTQKAGKKSRREIVIGIIAVLVLLLALVFIVFISLTK